MRIPKTFEVGGHTFTVGWLSNRRLTKFAGGESWGASMPASGAVWLNKKLHKYPKDLTEQTFLHEMMHCILWVVRSELWKDEALVDGIGHALLQAKKSAKF